MAEAWWSIQKIYLSGDCDWQRPVLTLIYFHNVLLEKNQGVLQMFWVSKVEDKIQAERRDDSFKNTRASAHFTAIQLHNVWSASGEHWFPVFMK